jgi:dipeptidyl aminopeptidase/acylaminoacyl peptidase
MVPEDVYELTGVSDPRLSPDGATVAFVVSRVDREENTYRANIWVAPADGSGPPRQLTFGAQRDTDPRWSPDGTRLAFVSKRGGDAGQLHVLPMAAGGEARGLTDLKEDVSQASWSPDGTRLAFVSRVRDAAYDEEDDKKRPPRRIKRLQFKLDNEGWVVDRPRHLFTVAADGSGGPAQLTEGDAEDGAPAWSPDGTRIAFVSARHEDWDTRLANDVYVVEASGGEPSRLTATDGGCDAPSWSPDGSRIAYRAYPSVADDPRHWQIAVLDVATRERRLLTTSLDRNCGPYPELREPIWEDGDRLLFAVEDGGNTHVYRVRAGGSADPEPVTSGELVITGYDAAGGRLVHTASTPTTFSELYAGSDRLTSVGEAFFAAREVPAPERFTAVSADGAEVEAWVLRPVGFDRDARYPCLLNVHGGPFAQYGNRFFDEFQVYAGAGYVVVFANPRGSSGYSEAWGRAIRGPVDGGPGWGSVDYQDLMAVVDEAVKRFEFIDPDRLAVMGGSYGGYMASWMVGHTDRFRTAISERACNNFVSMWGSSDFGWDFKGYFGSYIYEDPEPYIRMSPVTYAKDITTPLLILHSENDLRCPIEQAEQLFTTLRLLKREVEFVRFPEESHELTRSGNPMHRVTRFEIILDWLGRYLKD